MNKKKYSQKNLLFIYIVITIVIVLICNFGKIVNNNYNNTYNLNNETNIINKETVDFKNDELQVLFFYVGQADCTLIKYNDQTMLIDAGNNEDGNNIADYLLKQGIKSINYLIGTHSDEDHIGGIDDIINKLDIANFYMPEVGKEEINYKNAVIAADSKNIKLSYPNKGDKFEIGEVNCEIMSAMKYDNISDNNSSIVISANYKNNKFLFMGDAEKEVENSRSWDKVDVLKVGHHGSNTASSKEFLEQVSPKYSVIEVGKNNKYRLPSNKTIERINDVGSKIIRTDINQSSFLMTSDGEEISAEEIKLNLDGNK